MEWAIVIATVLFYIVGMFIGLIGYDSNRDAEAEIKQHKYFNKLGIITVLVFLFLLQAIN